MTQLLKSPLLALCLIFSGSSHVTAAPAEPPHGRFLEAREALKAGRLDAACEVYRQIAATPGVSDELVSDALFNAGVVRQMQERWVDADLAFAELIARVPETLLAIDSQIARASMAEARGDLWGAAEGLASLPTPRWLKGDKRRWQNIGDALRDAGTLYVALGEARLAAEVWGRFLARHPRRPDAHRVALEHARVLGLVEADDAKVASARAYAQAAKRYRRLGPGYQVEALQGAALAYFATGEKRHVTKAYKHFAQVVRLWERHRDNQDDRLSTLSSRPDERRFAADAQQHLADRIRAQARWPVTLDLAKLVSKRRRLAKQVDKRVTAARACVAAYQQALLLESSMENGFQATLGIAGCETDVANDLDAIVSRLEEPQDTELSAGLSTYRDQFREQAQHAIVIAVDKTKASEVYTDAGREAAILAGQLMPETYPITRFTVASNHLAWPRSPFIDATGTPLQSSRTP